MRQLSLVFIELQKKELINHKSLHFGDLFAINNKFKRTSCANKFMFKFMP